MRSSARAVAAVLAALGTAGVAALGVAHGTAAAASAPRPAETTAQGPVAEEMSMNGLAIGAQQVQGAHAIAETTFPPPGAPLAITGSFVRVFFGFSSEAGPGSTMTISVNDMPLATLPLTRATSAGGVVEERVPSAQIAYAAPTRLRVVFDLDAPASVARDQLFGRVDPSTLIHYSLAAPVTGAAGLETYPFSLLATNASSPNNPSLGITLASPPDRAEVAVALQALTDVGRRAGTQLVRTMAVPPAKLTNPGTSGGGLLVIGRLDRLAAASSILDAGGWRLTSAGWMAPDGTVAAPGDGLLASAISPFDGKTLVILVTGATDAALERAGAELAGARPIPLSGPFAISTPGATQGTPTPAASEAGPARTGPTSLDLTGPPASDLADGAGGVYEADLPFVAPAVAPAATAQALLTVPQLGAAARGAEVDLAVDGVHAASTNLDAAVLRQSTVTLSFLGRLLHPGRNSIAVTFHLAPAGAGAAVGAGAVAATLRLPAPDAAPDLSALPYPFVGASGPPRWVLADASSDALTAAAAAAVALGRQAAQAPDLPAVMLVSDQGVTAGTADLVVVGAPTSGGPMAPISAELPLRILPGGIVTVAGGAAGRQLSSSVAAVQEVRIGARTVLWLTGEGAALRRAAESLNDPGLSGQLAVVDAQGHVTAVAVPAEVPAPTTPPGPSGALLLVAATVAVLIVALAALTVIPLVGARGLAG